MQQLGDYKLIEKIGAGGMGEVWRAENVHTKLRYAVKLLPLEATRDRNFVARFFDEGRVMAELEHPRIVRVHHVGYEEKSGRYYLVMDFVAGPQGAPQSLHDVLAASEINRLTQTQVRKWATQVAEGLAYAHSRGVIHRDIKPANILIDTDGNARITDFGLAKAVGEEFVRTQIHQSIQLSMHGTLSDTPTVAKVQQSLGDQPTLSPDDSRASHRTTAESLLGTYDYMSPEQRGELPGVAVGAPSDIYAFGVMLYRLLTGRRPTGRAKPASQLVGGLSKSWDQITDRCLEHQPHERYANGAELLAALKQTARGGSGVARWVKVVASLVVAVAMIAAGYVGWTRLRPASTREVRPVAPVTAADPSLADAPKVPFRVMVEPAGAMVTLTHDRLGLVAEERASAQGLALDLEPGTYHALVTADGYRTVQQDIEVSEADPQWQVRLSERRGNLLVASNPGVSVSVTDSGSQAVLLGTTDAQGRLIVTTLREGDYTLSLSLADYRAATVEVSLLEGRQVEARKLLDPLPGRLKIGGRTGMEVYEAGRRLGQANAWIDLSAGQHDLELRCAGFRTERMQVTIPPNRPVTQQSPTLVAESGSIRITASSTVSSDDYLDTQRAEIRIDGDRWREVALPYLAEGLSCESHAVELRIAGYAQADSRQVTVRDGQTSAAPFRLTPGASASRSTVPRPEMEVSGESLMCWYPMNGSGEDESGHNRRGRTHGTALCQDRFGEMGATFFDGKNGWFETPPMVLPQEFTINFWLKSPPSNRARNGETTFLVKGLTSAPWNEIIMSDQAGDKATDFGVCVRQFAGRHNEVVFSEADINDNRWHMWSIIVSGDRLRLYKDLRLLGAVRGNPSWRDTTERPFVFMKHWNSGGYAEGALDDIRIYGRALSETELASLQRR